MIALNIALMLAAVIGIVSLLAGAIVSDRRSHRSAGGEVAPAQAPLHRDLTMPRELRAQQPRLQTRPARRRVPSAA